MLEFNILQKQAFETRHMSLMTHPIIHFWFAVTFSKEVTKILHNLCFHSKRRWARWKKPEIKSRNYSDQNTNKPKDDNMG